jgi:hypothetical protein
MKIQTICLVIITIVLVLAYGPQITQMAKDEVERQQQLAQCSAEWRSKPNYNVKKLEFSEFLKVGARQACGLALVQAGRITPEEYAKDLQQ